MTTATPVAAAVERVGISIPDLARCVGINEPSCWDLLGHTEEVSMCLSLRQLSRLASALGVPAISLLPDSPGPATRRHTLGELADTVRGFCANRGLSAEQFGDKAGWDVQRFLQAPDSALDDWCLDSLRGVCDALGVHWPDFLPDAMPVV